MLAYFNPSKPVTLSTDASSYGIGTVLMQDGRPVAYASAALNETQQSYAQIEKELLAVIFACTHFHYYIFGRSVEVHTDHKPLIGLKEKPYDKVSSRLQRLLLRLNDYDVTLTYVPGKHLPIADALSRAPDPTGMIEDNEGVYPIRVCTLATASTPKFLEIRAATAQDETLQAVIHHLNNGWPQHRFQVQPEVRPFYDVRDELYVTDGFLCRGQRLVLPLSCRSDALNRLHDAHRGIVSCKNRAREALYWPSMNRDIENMIKTCEVCQRHQRSNQHEPLADRQLTDRPWQQVGMDFFHLNGITYLLVIDYFSKYVDVQQMKSFHARALIDALKTCFARFGVPEIAICDNGPPFDSVEFRRFLKDWDIVYNPCSPYNPRSNGQAERAVQTIKASLIKSFEDGKDLSEALLDYRSTPINGLKSPAELLMGRKLRTKVPTLSSNLMPQFNCQDTRKVLRQRQTRQHVHGDAKSKHLEPLHLQQDVWYRRSSSWCPGVITRVGPGARSYTIRSREGRYYRRNRFHIRPAFSLMPAPSAEDYDLRATTERQGSVIEETESEHVSQEPIAMRPCPVEPREPGRLNSAGYTTRSGRVSVPPIRYQSNQIRTLELVN